MDDAMYRLYLKWKIALNTTNCTHADRHRAFKMFWDNTPVYYSEDPAHPATIFLTVPDFTPESEAAARISVMIKAAGVAVHFILKEAVTAVNDYDACAENVYIREFVMEPFPIPKAADYDAMAVSAIIKQVNGA